jgi:hypothetical protein
MDRGPGAGTLFHNQTGGHPGTHFPCHPAGKPFHSRQSVPVDLVCRLHIEMVMKKTLFLEADLYSGPRSAERRQQERFPLDHRAEIKLIAKDGRLLTAEVTVEDWSDSGCRVVSGIRLKTGDIIALKPLDKDPSAADELEPRLFEIIWTNRRIAFWIAGAVKLHGENPARRQFLPASSTTESSSK